MSIEDLIKYQTIFYLCNWVRGGGGPLRDVYQKWFTTACFLCIKDLALSVKHQIHSFEAVTILTTRLESTWSSEGDLTYSFFIS